MKKLATIVILFFVGFCFANNTKTNLNNEQILSPTLDGSLAQSSGTFNTTSTSADIKRASGFNREIYLDFELTSLTINPKSGKLKIYCQSFDKFGDVFMSLYSLSNHNTNALTWANRPTVTTAIATKWITQNENVGSYLEFDISSSLATTLASTSKKVTFVLKITAGSTDPLIKLTMNESASNKPTLVLSDQNPVNLGVNSVIKMPTLFADNMVIQRDKPIRVWGEVLPNSAVSITFDGQNYYTQSSANGKFSMLLPAKTASASSYTMTVSSNNETFSYSNIVMGDVYLCGGQSNMAMTINSVQADQKTNATTDANYPNLRFFEVAKIVSGGFELKTVDNTWKSAVSGRIINWAAIPFFIGRDLHKELNVPIGLINVSHGGAPSDAFISPEAYANDVVLDAAKRPNSSGINALYESPSTLFTAMISKVVGCPIKAVLWYQAEANTSYWQNYKTIFTGLIKDWRNQFNNPTLPWLFVQLPGLQTGGVGNFNWAETRDIQLQVSKEDPNTAMTVAIDLGVANDIHPTDKYTVAKRMYPQVKALVYGEEIINKSPIYQSHEINGAEMTLSFDNVGGGLKSTKAITEFEIAGSDKVYKPATAILTVDNKIKLTNATIANPMYARYAFLNFPTVSIYTTDALSLPLSPFKTETGGTLTIKDFNKTATNLVVYPNPTTGVLNISKKGEPTKIEVFDLTGKRVISENFSNKIDLSLLNKGIYFLRTNLNQVVKVAVE